MLVVDLRDLGRKRACIDYEPHGFLRRRRGLLRQRVAQVEMVDDDIHVCVRTRASRAYRFFAAR